MEYYYYMTLEVGCYRQNIGFRPLSMFHSIPCSTALVAIESNIPLVSWLLF